MANKTFLYGSISAFTPLSISGCVYWQTPPIGVIESAGQITDVQDQSIKGNDATQPTFGEQPTLVGGVINYDGVADNLNMDPVIANIGGATNFTLWARVRPTTGLVFNEILNFGDTDGNEFIQMIGDSLGRLRVLVRIGGVDQWNLVTTGVKFVDNTWVDIGITHAGSTNLIYINGFTTGQTYITTTDQTKSFIDATGLDNARQGALNFNSLGNIVPYDGDVQEMAIYNTTATAEEMENLSNYNNP